jgi:hypothetical protein
MKKFEHMEYICDKIIHIVEFENCIYISKLELWVELFGELFYGVWYSYTSIKSRTILKFKVFGWNFIKKMCFIAF